MLIARNNRLYLKISSMLWNYKNTWNRVVFLKKLNVILEAICLSWGDNSAIIEDGSVMAPIIFDGTSIPRVAF